MTDKDGGPAFPRPAVVWENQITGRQTGENGDPGMTLRQYATIEMMKAWRIALTKTDDIGALHSPVQIYELAAADADALIQAEASDEPAS